ncbi:hypothetical protein [Candidatus Electrothrix sp.]|uniref:hypothetical protein n=1 Tax=Candidatus Electrothrix sp. TaxID=2170559 RepID=UPI004055B75B
MHYARIILTLTLAFLVLAGPWPAAAEEEFVTALTGKFPPLQLLRQPREPCRF